MAVEKLVRRTIYQVQCEHKNLSPNYLGGGNCGTPYCSVYENHCLDCGIFISQCGCGYNNGMDGWSWKQRMNWERKKYGS